jgi:hypothetical protein
MAQREASFFHLACLGLAITNDATIIPSLHNISFTGRKNDDKQSTMYHPSPAPALMEEDEEEWSSLVKTKTSASDSDSTCQAALAGSPKRKPHQNQNSSYW